MLTNIELISNHESILPRCFSGNGDYDYYALVGDKILDLVFYTDSFTRAGIKNVEELSTHRSILVSNENMALCCHKLVVPVLLSIEDYDKMSSHEKGTVFEAIVGLIFIQQGSLTEKVMSLARYCIEVLEESMPECECSRKRKLSFTEVSPEKEVSSNAKSKCTVELYEGEVEHNEDLTLSEPLSQAIADVQSDPSEMPIYESLTIGGKIQPRPYQREVADTAIAKNTIINLRTGGGKTLIAVLLIDHFLKYEKEKKILFVVPSRALVDQQAKYIRKNSTSTAPGMQVLVGEFCGNDMCSWSRSDWERAKKDNDVFVGTAEVFRHALVDQGFLKPSDFSLIVIDECHNAVGNNPMAAILRDSILRADEPDRPRLLGMTASFVNGKMKDIMKKRSDLEALFNGNLIAPVIEEDATESEKSYVRVNVPHEDLSSYEPFVRPMIDAVLKVIGRDLGKEYDKWGYRGVALFEELGFLGLRFWLKEGILMQLKAQTSEMKKRIEDKYCVRRASRLEAALPKLGRLLNSTTDIQAVVVGSNTRPPPQYSKKLIALLELLFGLVGCDRTSSSTRGIVFVEQVSVTYPLAAIVNRYFTLRREWERCGRSSGNLSASVIANMGSEEFKMEEIQVESMLPVSGANSMSDVVRERNLDSFRTGAIPLLVSTNALEEGIDVPECNFVVRFDSFSTTKSHIQGSGRARCSAARIFYFENDPEEERGKAGFMEAVGRDRGLNMSADDLRVTLTEIQNHSTVGFRAPVLYPFRPDRQSEPSKSVESGDARLSTANRLSLSEATPITDDDCTGEVNFFNCLTIFYKFVQRVLGQSIDPEALLELSEEIVCSFPFESRTVLLAVTYPTTSGYKQLDRDEIDSFWGPYAVEDVVQPKERYLKMKTVDREKRRAVYVVVLRLHELGLLTASNEPTSVALQDTKRVCQTLPLPTKLNLKNKYHSKLLIPNSPTSCSLQTVQLTPIITPPHKPQSAVVSAISSPSSDYKSKLLCLVQKLNPYSLPQTLLSYETPTTSDGSFVCTVTLQDTRFKVDTAVGKTCKKKKDAEQSAALALLEANV